MAKGHKVSEKISEGVLVAVFGWVPFAVIMSLVARWVRDGVAPEPILAASLVYWFALMRLAFGVD